MNLLFHNKTDVFANRGDTGIKEHCRLLLYDSKDSYGKVQSAPTFHALKDRDLPQDSEIRLQSGGAMIAHRRPDGQSGIRLLHHQLAYPLVDNAQPFMSGRRSRTGIDTYRIDVLSGLVKDSNVESAT